MHWRLSTNESDKSGLALLDVEIPSGYIMLQPDALKIVRSGVIPQLRDANMEEPGRTLWYFDYIPSYRQCFQHTVWRYFPVANMSRTRQVLLIEPLRPERFTITTYNSTSIWILSVCNVCGSYQCPFCPFYSAAASFSPCAIVLALSLILYAIDDIQL